MKDAQKQTSKPVVIRARRTDEIETLLQMLWKQHPELEEKISATIKYALRGVVYTQHPLSVFNSASQETD